MKLSFLDRHQELLRLRRLLARGEPSFVVLYGRRRCGKSRLLQEALPSEMTVSYVADDREGPLQRAALAREIGRLVQGFERVAYPDWDSLLDRWWRDAPRGAVLCLDELPALVAVAPELPSLLQKRLDRARAGDPSLVVAGSSQRMMTGLVLDASAPLYGRAAEILRLGPLPAGWTQEGLGQHDPVRAVEAYSVWGGIPRYLELAREFDTLDEALRDLVLSPLGVLHDEPRRLLLDDVRDLTQSASILLLIGQGCHRLSEIAGRLGKPSTSLSRPLQRLLELGLVRRDIPAGASARDGKRSLYRINDPYLRFWFRYVEPNRSLLEAQNLDLVLREVRATFSMHVSGVWEDLVRESVPRHRCFETSWRTAASWWGPGLDRTPLEVDVVAESEDGRDLLVGEVKWTGDATPGRLLPELRRKAANLPLAQGKNVKLAFWLRSPASVQDLPADVAVFGPAEVLAALR